jgi:ABC-type branched-subunit amino acid transport system substrate-binding protein
VIPGRLASGSTVAAIGALAALVAGCATAPSAPTTTGKSLNIYLSAPASLKGDPQAQDVLDAEALAFSSTCTLSPSPTVQLGGFTVSLRALSSRKISDNARTAIDDTNSAAAYVGEIVPGTSEDSVGITNAQDLLQVSPTDNAVELTQRSAVVPGSWGRYYESLSTYGKTFARMVPTSAAEAAFLVGQMRGLGVHAVEVRHDGSDYGKAIAHAVSSLASGLTTTSASGADAVFYGGNSEPQARAALDQAAAANPGVKLFVPSALDNGTFLSTLSPAAQLHLYVSSPGFAAKSLPPGGRAFVKKFTRACGHAPAPPAIFGYAAMQALIAVLREAGQGVTSRSTVVRDFRSYSNKSSVLGAYSFKGGDIAITTAGGTPPFLLLRAKAGKLVQTG